MARIHRYLLPAHANYRLNWGLLILRVGMGISMMTHGYGKLLRVLEGNLRFGDPIGLGQENSLYLAVFAEFFCSILLMMGLFTRLAVIPLLITMAVAFFIVHGSDAFSVKELAFLYLLPYLFILLNGPGEYSLDHALFKHKV